MAQHLLGIKQLIAMPFVLDDEPVGNLIAAKRSEFTDEDIDFLTIYSRQAAISLQSQRHLAETNALERIILTLQVSMTDETHVLQLIVDAVVQTLGYAGAMVATMESDNSLPVRAFAKDFDSSMLDYLVDKLGISPVSPRSVVYLDDEMYADNLSVRAVQGSEGLPEKYLVSNSLYDLFRPIVNRPLSNLAQRLVGIKQVVAVPFFLDGEVVGNLFIATRQPHFSARDISILIAFGQQAAVGIRNARLYRKAEERRQIAQMFARMAFSASASVHALRNHIGSFRTFISLVRRFPQVSAERFSRIIESTGELIQRLDESAHLLENMHMPWQQSVDELTDVNACLGWAIAEIFPETHFQGRHSEVVSHKGVKICLQLTDNLLQIMTVPDMLTEAFRVILKNGVDALKESSANQPTIWISSFQRDDGKLEVQIQDNGIGIKTADLSKIFELGWSSKKGEGMGFGLFWAKDYIEGLGGHIKCESAYKKGTTFLITMPMGNNQS
jgi:signal transduction histidine kinase